MAQWLKDINGVCDNPLGAKRVLPFSAKNKPRNMEWTNMHSAVPNEDQLDVSGESKGGKVDNDYADDSEGSKDDSEESEEEIQTPPRTESRPKHHHDLTTTPSKSLVSRTRNVKHDQAAATESAEKAAKQPKPHVPKPRKALP